MTTPAQPGLPYGPAMTRALEPMRRAFLVVNARITGPMLRAGLGGLLATPLSGSMLLLRTRGRRSGLTREAPLGYAVHDGAYVVVAGYGRGAHWFANALAEPDVEVVVAGSRLACRAEELTEPVARREAFVAALAAMGVVGRMTVGDVRTVGPERLDALVDGFPVLALRPTAALGGPADPGGPVAWASLVAWAALPLAAWYALALRRARRRS